MDKRAKRLLLYETGADIGTSGHRLMSFDFGDTRCWVITVVGGLDVYD